MEIIAYARAADEIYDRAISLFGEINVQRFDYKEPFGCELSFKTKAIINNTSNSNFEVSIYENHIFMLIDDFRFEYKDIVSAKTEILKYLEAAANHNLHIKYWKFLGLKFNQRIVLETK